ncbi:MAG: T9SS type A sorting domain-containing protein [Lewinellaceae bacterium]|nr:T9SS type A sorting domain-containing protein [Saprospiraceae bacterium]MCB9338503.1 T9SS type A sorting domain-containing protein [Lewinellaceae bacterium]
MKQTLLAVLLTFCSLAAFSQQSPDGSGGAYPQESLSTQQPVKISIYPNPATNYISVNKAENVKQIAIFNLVGRKLKSFDDVNKDQHYDVTDLPNGMYLVRIIDNANKVITTQRISKR